MEILDRPIYLNRIVSQLNRGLMLVLVGQRRVGKSFILRMLDRWLRRHKPEADVIFIDKDFGCYDFINTADDLYRHVTDTFKPGEENYLLIDEVQNIQGYETALRSLYAEDRCQIVVTGSNAYIFSSEIATRFSGRYIEIPVRSLGYTEFLEFHNIDDTDEALLKYLRYGGMPGLVNYEFGELPEILAYLQGIYNTVILKDIVAREELRNYKFLENLIHFLADNVGQLISVNSIAKYVKAQGAKISSDSVSKYLKSISNALIVDSVARYDIHGKRLFELIEKYYFADHGIRNAIAGEMFNIFGSIEKLMENVVRHHLLICDYQVYVGVLSVGEIDFVAKKGSDIIYIQVAYKLSGPEVVRREFGNLMAIKDAYPKYVVTMEEVSGPLKEYPGIRHLNLREFLKLGVYM